MSATPTNKLIVALDVDSHKKALILAEQLKGLVGFFKVGMELFYSAGVGMVRDLTSFGTGVFLDLKMHDIPHTVAQAARVLVNSRAAIINVHASGGAEMMRFAADAVREEAGRLNMPAPLVIAVTVLTSIDKSIYQNELGFSGEISERVCTWAELANNAGLDGVVCSPQEIRLVREACGPKFVIITPGIRPAGAQIGDQRRIMTPREAILAGASYIVVGRPITEADDPAKAAKAILKEIAEA